MKQSQIVSSYDTILTLVLLSKEIVANFLIYPHVFPAGGTNAAQKNFYEEWWFLVIVALVGTIVIILVGASLCMLGRSRLYVGTYHLACWVASSGGHFFEKNWFFEMLECRNGSTAKAGVIISKFGRSA